jgi:hypothetical protein
MLLIRPQSGSFCLSGHDRYGRFLRDVQGSVQIGIVKNRPQAGNYLSIRLGLIRQYTPYCPKHECKKVRALRPYKDGDDLLWAINELNRGDKHRPKLIPVLTNSRWQLGFMGVEKGGEVYIIGDRRSGHLSVNQADGKPYVSAKNRHPYAEGEVEIVTCAPGTKFHTDMKPLCQIAFGKIEVLKTEPVVKVLHQMRDLVESILLTFERRVF